MKVRELWVEDLRLYIGGLSNRRTRLRNRSSALNGYWYMCEACSAEEYSTVYFFHYRIVRSGRPLIGI
jgi:hypothetical protein